MKATIGAVVAVVLAVSAVAAQAADKKPGGSCRMAEMVCADYDAAIAKNAKEACEKYKMKWSNEPCPTAKQVGTCTRDEGGGNSYTHSYPPGTAETAKKACDNTPGGKFTK